MSAFEQFLENFEMECFLKKKSPSSVCRELGLTSSAYSYWKKEKTIPRKRTLEKIASYFGCTVEYLVGGNVAISETEKMGSSETPSQEEPAPKIFGIKPIVVRNKLPIYGLVSAGKGVYADEDILGYEFADERYSAPEYFYLEVRGDSMSPRIDEGDLVLVHRQEWIDSGQVGIFVVGDNAFCKKIVYQEEELDLISFNPYYPPMRFSPEEAQDVHVIGRVLESKRKYE